MEARRSCRLEGAHVVDLTCARLEQVEGRNGSRIAMKAKRAEMLLWHKEDPQPSAADIPQTWEATSLRVGRSNLESERMTVTQPIHEPQNAWLIWHTGVYTRLLAVVESE